MRIVKLSSQSVAFPSPEAALHDPNGLLAIGGDLAPARLLAAYERGIFPGIRLGKPSSGGHRTLGRCCSQRNSMSAAASSDSYATRRSALLSIMILPP